MYCPPESTRNVLSFVILALVNSFDLKKQNETKQNATAVTLFSSHCKINEII